MMARVCALTGLAVLLLCVLPSHAGYYPATARECVSVTTQSAYGRSKSSDVATCERAQDLEASTQRLQGEVDALQGGIEQDLADQEGDVAALREDVDVLQGKNTTLGRFRAFVGAEPLDVRPFCEIYTIGEAAEFGRLLYNIENTNPHFVHLPCAPNCPEKFWKIRQGCYRPNDGPRAVMGPNESPIFDCFYDPIPEGETCTRIVYIGAFGYTTRLEESWMEMGQKN